MKKQRPPKRTTKQYGFLKDNGVSQDDFNRLLDIANDYSDAKNFFYSMFSGIKSYEKLFDHRKEIRDVIVADVSKGKYNFNLPARYWKNALEDAVANIKVSWDQCLKDVKKNIFNRGEELTEHEKHYIFYIIKAYSLLHCVLNERFFVVPDKVKYDDIDFVKLNNIIRRVVRLYKPNISYTNKRTGFLLDTDMYGYEGNFICIQSKEKGRRIKVRVNTEKRYKTSIRVILNKNLNRVEIHGAINLKTKPKEVCKEEKIIGVDKNYENVITTSTENIYGDKINKLFNKYTDTVVDGEKRRNSLRNLIKKYKKQGGKDKKIENIIKHNLGDKKISRKKDCIKEEFKSLINHSIDKFFKEEKPTVVPYEDLTFRSKKKSKYNRKAKHKMNSWCKGYIQERLLYKAYIYNVGMEKINAAGTSQACSYCGFFTEKRSDGDMFHCPNCNRVVLAHINSARNVKQRLNDTEIKVDTPPKEVFRILRDRNKRMLELKTVPSKTSDTTARSPSKSELSETCKILQDF